MKISLRTVGYLGAAATLAGVIFIAVRPAPVAVETGQVVVGPMQVTVDEQGETRSHDRFVIAAPVYGRLLRVRHRDGDSVAADEIVARIAPLPLSARERDELNARIAAAAATRRSAEANLNHALEDAAQASREQERAEQLFARGLIARQSLEQARNSATTLEKEVEAARYRARAAAADLQGAQAGLLALKTGDRAGVALVEIRAPVSGRILRILEPSERVVVAGAPILVIGDLKHLEVVMEMLSSEAVKLTPGMPASLEGWGGDKPLRARVRFIEPYAFTKVSALGVEEKRTNVFLEFVDPPGALGDGFRLTGRIVTWEAAAALKAPVSALFRCQSAWCVFILDSQRVRRRAVGLGHLNSDEAEILSGLRANDRVIRHPSNDLRDGARVNPIT